MVAVYPAVMIISIEDGSRAFLAQDHDDYLEDTNQRDYGEIPLSVLPKVVFRPPREGTPTPKVLKPGQKVGHMELIFRRFLPVDQEHVRIALGAGFGFTNPKACQSNVSEAYPHVLETSCSSKLGSGVQAGKWVGKFTLRPTNITTADWLLATDVAIPLIEPADSYMWYNYRDQTEWRQIPLLMKSVGGSRRTLERGGHTRRAAIFPRDITVGEAARVSFIFHLTNAVVSGGSVIIVPPTSMGLADVVCTHADVKVQVTVIHPTGGNDRDEVVTVDESVGDWQCSKKGTNAIMLRRINRAASGMNLIVKFKVTVAEATNSGKTGSAVIMTCTDATGCDAVDNEEYVANDNYVDYGITMDTMNVN
eukprot:Filipodium_phascolosomae@DN5125_c0_g1_i1.p1